MKTRHQIRRAKYWRGRITFLYYWKGRPQRMTLLPNDSKQLHTSGRTDEGWESRSETFKRCGAKVVRESATDGRDCDGRLSTHDISCLARTRGHRYEGRSWPTWLDIDRSQRDYAAEADGY